MSMPAVGEFRAAVERIRNMYESQGEGCRVMRVGAPMLPVPRMS